MHDVISDILASPTVPRSRKRAEILRAGAAYRDSTSYAMTRDEWRAMSIGMDVEMMGGRASGDAAPVVKPDTATSPHAGHTMPPN